MSQRPVVPKFGNWESEDNVPYTVYFEKARKGKTGGKMMNPNDPQENSEMFPDSAQEPEPPSREKNAPEELEGRKAVKPATHERRTSRDDVDPRQIHDAAPRNDNAARRGSTGSAHQNRGGHGSGSGRPARQSGGSEHSVDRSPLHPQYQAKLAGRGSASPAWEGKHSYDSSHGTPGRSRMKPASRGDESPDKGAAVPRFGEWDENDPASADNYTHIFNKVREERISGTPNNITSDPSYANRKKQNDQDKSKCSCFPCFGK